MKNDFNDRMHPIRRIGDVRFFSSFIDRLCLIIVGTVIGFFILLLCQWYQEYMKLQGITKQERVQQERDRIYAIQKASHIPTYKITVTQND